MRLLAALLVTSLLPAGALLAQELLEPLEAPPAPPSEEQDQFDFANGLLNRGFFAEAADEYQRYLDRFPQGRFALLAALRMGDAAYAAGRHEAALKAYDTALPLASDEHTRSAAALSRGEVLYFLGRHEESMAALTPLAAGGTSDAQQPRALYFLARALREAKHPDDARAKLSTLLEKFPADPLAPYAQYQRALTYLDSGDMENAAIDFSAVAAAKTDADLRMECRYRAAEIYDKMGWHSAAVGAYEQLRSEFPGSDYARRAEYGYAWSLFHAGKPAEAREQAERSLKENPESQYRAGLEYLRGCSFQQEKQYEAATQVFSALRQAYPNTEFADRALFKLSWVRYLQGDIAGAKADVLAFLAPARESMLVGDAAFLLGSILVSEGNYEEAQHEFRRVARDFPGSEFAPDALYKSGECLAQLGMSAPAAQAFEEFVQKYPDHALAENALLRLGDAHFDSKNFAAAVEKYQSLLDRAKDPGAREDTLYRLAATYHNMKDFANSAKSFTALLDAFPNTPRKAEACFRVAETRLRDDKDALKALEFYQAALDADPKGPFAARALKGLALARFENNDLDLAAELFLRVIREFPVESLNEETYAWTGERFFEQGAWEKAAAAFEALLKAVPGYPYHERVRFKIAECADREGRADDAIARYQAVIDAAPASGKAVEAKYRIAVLLEGKGETEKAAALYNEAANANNGEVAALARYRLGELHETKGEFDLAARSFMRVAILFLHKDLSPKALLRAAQCFEKSGSTEQARKAYGELVADYPESAEASQAGEALARIGTG